MTKVAIVTGGASGIGRALGEALAAEGTEVVLADRQLGRAEEVARGIGGRGGRARAVDLDVRSFEAFEGLVEETLERSGRIDYLFNNAGIGVGGEIADYAPDDWDDVVDVNLRGVAYGIQAVYPVMRKQGSGHIVNTASVAGLVPAAGAASYTATKHAVVGMSKVLRIEARRHGVRVSALCPGVIRTPILTGGEYGRTAGVQPSEAKMLEMWERLRPMDVDAFAQRVLKEVHRNRAIIVVPGWWKAIWLIERLSPALSMAIWTRMHARTLAALESEVEQQAGTDGSDEARPATRA